MLDSDTRLLYYVHMKKKHPPIYYTTRSIVRFAVWGGLFALFLIFVVRIGQDNRPPCDIRIASASPPRWVSDTPVDVSKCVAPQYMVLHNDGSWSWVDE